MGPSTWYEFVDKDLIPPTWYEFVHKDDTLEQGDILFKIPLLFTRDDPYKGDIEVEIEEYNGIIMSQTCDIEHKDLDVILFCPIITLEEWILKVLPNPKNTKELANTKNNLRKGGYVAYFLLNSINELEFPDDYYVVDMRNPRNIPIGHVELVKAKTAKRPRLSTPYREHLSQAFARVFMRVGLPDGSEIPEF
jgi:hypothetical protein